MCDERSRSKNKRLAEEAERARMEEEVWKIVNRERNRRKRVNRDIKMVDCIKYYVH